jgi:hypothetical protein
LSEPEKPLLTVFLSYSQSDEREKDHLLSHLKVLQIGSSLIDVWSEDRIGVGLDWEDEIRLALDQAQIVILLVTANYLGTEFIIKDTIPTLLQRRREEGLVVFPVIARPSAWQKVDWLAQMSVRPRSHRPVWGQGGSHADEDLALIAEEIATIASRALPAVSSKKVERPPETPRQPTVSPAPFSTAKIRRLLTDAFDDPGLDAFCQDYFYVVYRNFSRGMQRTEKLNLLLDHCRRAPRGLESLLEALQEQFQGDETRLSAIADLLPNQ